PSVPETLRDLAYRHENEVEEEINEKEPSTLIPFIAPLGESGSSIPTGSPLIRTSVPWKPQTEKLNGFEHVYEGRFPRIFMGNVPTKAKLKMTTVTGMNKCTEKPCENGGRCRLDTGAEVGFTCSCKEGWTGPLCQ
ncbi:hypothetical protein WUBG_17863, partial [Wuchereria bancrofti]